MSSGISRKEVKYFNSENIVDFRKFQTVNHSERTKIYSKSFSSKNGVIEFYTSRFKDLEPMLSNDQCHFCIPKIAYS